MPKIETNLQVGFSRVLQQLHNDIMAAGMTMGNAGTSDIQLQGSLKLSFRVYEKYFMRAGNYASLAVVLVGDENSCRVSAISSGGGGGLLNISWGANTTFLRVVEDSLRALR